MVRRNVGCAVVLAALLGALAGAEEKGKTETKGTWSKMGAQFKLEFVDKETLKLYPHGGNDIVIVCKFSAEKDGKIKAKVSDFEGKDDLKQKIQNVIPAGLEFSFKWQVNNDAATLEEVRAEKAETLQTHLEGKYELKS